MEIPKLELPFDIVKIQQCIPHRYPFLLIDRVIALEPHKSITALKNVSFSDPILQGHFPERPIYPGVLIIEAIAQASGVLGVYTNGQRSNEVLLAEVLDTRFRQIVEPGASLRYEVAIEKRRGAFFWFKGEAFIGDNLAASVRFAASMK